MKNDNVVMATGSTITKSIPFNITRDTVSLSVCFFAKKKKSKVREPYWVLFFVV